MLANLNGIQVHYADHGSGLPVLGLHGGGVDHREIMAALEPLFTDRPGYRRIYPDLPGMGRTPAPETIDSTDAVLELLLGLVDAVIGEEAFLVVGHSSGGYLAQAIASRRPRQAAGLALICPLVGEGGGEDPRPEHVVLTPARTWTWTAPWSLSWPLCSAATWSCTRPRRCGASRRRWCRVWRSLTRPRWSAWERGGS